MKPSILSVILALVICTPVFAAANADFPPISIIAPGAGGSPVDKTQFLILDVEPGFISCAGGQSRQRE